MFGRRLAEQFGREAAEVAVVGQGDQCEWQGLRVVGPGLALPFVSRPKEKLALKKLFEKFLAINLRKQAVEEFLLLTQNIGKEAEANGLTEELIEEILAES